MTDIRIATAHCPTGDVRSGPNAGIGCEAEVVFFFLLVELTITLRCFLMTVAVHNFIPGLIHNGGYDDESDELSFASDLFGERLDRSVSD